MSELMLAAEGLDIKGIVYTKSSQEHRLLLRFQGLTGLDILLGSQVALEGWCGFDIVCILCNHFGRIIHLRFPGSNYHGIPTDNPHQ